MTEEGRAVLPSMKEYTSYMKTGVKLHFDRYIHSQKCMRENIGGQQEHCCSGGVQNGGRKGKRQEEESRERRETQSLSVCDCIAYYKPITGELGMASVWSRGGMVALSALRIVNLLIIKCVLTKRDSILQCSLMNEITA